MPFVIESIVGLSALTLWVAGASIDGLLHVTLVRVLSIIQITINNGGSSSNILELIMKKRALGRWGGEMGKSLSLEVLFASGIRRACAYLRIIRYFVFKLIRWIL